MQTQRRDPRPGEGVENAEERDARKGSSSSTSGGIDDDPIVDELRKLYDGIADEPLPDQLIDLLRKLDEVERSR